MQRKANGMLMTLTVIGVCGLVAFLPDLLTVGDTLLTVVAAASMLAIRSLYEHVDRVVQALKSGDLEASRAAVSMIVGRDTSELGHEGVAGAAIESLAESTCDGVVAPLCFGLAFGLPGIVIYKAINTMDSMVGHKTPRYKHFGWFAARCDDIVNYLPARLTAFLFMMSAMQGPPGKAFLADARRHRSPNAGWPEAAMAYLLNVRLSGPRVYGGQLIQEPWINAQGDGPDVRALEVAMRLYRRTVLCLVIGLAVWVVLID